jgi:hypothetical protein
MSVNSYTSPDEMKRMHPRVIETAGTTVGELDNYCQLAEDEINGALGGAYTIPFSGGAPPLIRTIAREKASYVYLRSQIFQQDGSRSPWVEAIGERADRLLQGLIEGTIKLVTGSGTLIDRITTPDTTIWSSTQDYVPTFDLRDMTEQEIDEDRLDDLEARAE